MSELEIKKLSREIMHLELKIVILAGSIGASIGGALMYVVTRF